MLTRLILRYTQSLLALEPDNRQARQLMAKIDEKLNNGGAPFRRTCVAQLALPPRCLWLTHLLYLGPAGESQP